MTPEHHVQFEILASPSCTQIESAVCLLHEAISSAREKRMQTLPQFKVLQRGEQPPDEGYHVLLVHRFSSDWRALVHDITSRVPPSAGKVCHLTGRNAFTGTPGEALRAADQMATECGAPVVYVRDDT